MARRTGLGKGLGALIPADAVGDRDALLRELPLGSIKPNRTQPRKDFDEEAMASLAASIKELGVLQPILVREFEGESGSYELIAGERRLRAARRASLQTIPALVQSSTTDVNSLEQALVENLQRQDLNAIEEADAYVELIDTFGLTHEQVATRVGRSRTAVTNILRLLQLPAGIKTAVRDGALSAAHARTLLALPDRNLQETLANRVATEGLSVRALELMVKELNPQQSYVPAPTPPEAAPEQPSTTNGNTVTTTKRTPREVLPEPGVTDLELWLGNHLNTRVTIDMHGKPCRLVIDFADLEDLERISRRMVEGLRDQDPVAAEEA
jgi:ParB family chromosome partitioning protein